MKITPVLLSQLGFVNDKIVSIYPDEAYWSLYLDEENYRVGSGLNKITIVQYYPTADVMCESKYKYDNSFISTVKDLIELISKKYYELGQEEKKSEMQKVLGLQKY